MIISKTPFRVSFFGGGTDYPVYYREQGGAVLSTTIDKYCYLTCRHLPPFFDHKHRIVYTNTENVNSTEEIKHPSVREVFRFFNIQKGMEIHHDADLPARSGLGSSSSFTVGLLNSIYALKGQTVSPKKLAMNAIYIEQEMIKEHVGSQDQVATAFGGFNKIIFQRDGSIEVQPVVAKTEVIIELQNSLLFFFTGFTRIASNVAKHQIKETPRKQLELSTMFSMVNEAKSILQGNDEPIRKMGELLHESWMLKRGLTKKISNHEIDDIYETAIRAGAFGGKILGAGGGGFMLFIARRKYHTAICEKLKKLLHVPIKFDNTGSRIIVNNPSYDK